MLVHSIQGADCCHSTVCACRRSVQGPLTPRLVSPRQQAQLSLGQWARQCSCSAFQQWLLSTCKETRCCCVCMTAWSLLPCLSACCSPVEPGCCYRLGCMSRQLQCRPAQQVCQSAETQGACSRCREQVRICGTLTGTGSTSEPLLPAAVLALSFLTSRAVSSTSTWSAGFSASTCRGVCRGSVSCCLGGSLLCCAAGAAPPSRAASRGFHGGIHHELHSSFVSTPEPPAPGCRCWPSCCCSSRPTGWSERFTELITKLLAFRIAMRRQLSFSDVLKLIFLGPER